MTRLLLLLIALGSTADDEPPADPRCARLANVPFPAGDRPGDAQRAALAGCDPEDLYYGITSPADPVKARLCAYRDAPADQTNPLDRGKTVLMMIYANGSGAKRNLDLAMRLACELWSAPAELDTRLDHLERLRGERAEQSTFDICDDITSGFMMGSCAAHHQRVEKAKLDRKGKARMAGWSERDHAAWGRLRRTADAFFEARVGGEVDLSGTARAMFQFEAQGRLEEGLDLLAGKLEAGTLPAATPADFQAADGALNAAYRAAMRSDPDQLGTVTTGAIKKAERAWLAYRDEWVRFGHAKYPTVRSEAIKTWLTRERTDQLMGKDGPER